MGGEWLQAALSRQSAISLHTSVENIWDFNKKKSSDLGQNMILKLIPDTVSTSGCRCKIKSGHSIFWLFQLTTNPRKNIDKTILCCHKSSEQLSETLSQRSTIPSWSWLLRWRPLSFQSWYQSHDRKVSDSDHAALPLVDFRTMLNSHWLLMMVPSPTQENPTATIIFPPRTQLLCFYFKHISRGGGF